MAGEAAPIVIIGAGPAGLSLAAALRRAGCDALLLEGGETPGSSWRRMPRHMPLNSPWGVDLLPGSRVSLWRWGKVPSRAEYYDYLIDYAREQRIPIEAQTRVEKVEPLPGGGFRLVTNRGNLATRLLVNATGYFHQPFVPRVPGADRASLVQVRIPEYGDAAQLRERLGAADPSVLIVGARITAGQLAQELVDEGFRVALSLRSPLRFGWAPRIQRLSFRLYYPWERRRLRSEPAFARKDSGHPMPGGRSRWLIWRGRIAKRPALVALDGAEAVFADGRRERFDALIWATGYRPALQHLETLVRLDPESGLPALRGAESAEVPDLFFLGLDQQTDFTSRMLRGIRRDAERLASVLEQRQRTQ